MRVGFALGATIVTALAGGCVDSPSALTTARGRLTAAISDGNHADGNPAFFFLPPLVPNPGPPGAADPTLHPEVDICAWDGTECGTIIAHFTMDLATTTTTHPGNSETVRPGGGHYLVNWHTGSFALDPAVTYRICVSVEGHGLGHADVDVVASGRELKDVDDDAFVPLLNGRTLPIRFRIGAGALDQPADEGCAGDGGGTPV